MAATPHPWQAAGPPFERWVAARAPALNRFAYVLTGSTADADAAVQRALTSARLRWARLRDDPDLDARLQTLVARAYLRRRGRDRPPPPVGRPAADEPDDPWLPVAGTAGEPDDEAVRLWHACADLPPRRRAVLVLSCYAGQGLGAIATATRMRRTTAAATLADALADVLAGVMADAPAGVRAVPGQREARVRRALQQYAETAPPAYAPAERAITQAHRRRRRHLLAAAGAAAVLVVPGAWTLASGGLSADAPPVTPRARPAPVDVSGWRWESWGGVEVQVPPAWGHADLTQWCADGGVSGPAVDRPETRSSHALCSLYDDGRPTYTAGLLLRWAASSPRLSRADVAPYASTRIFTLGDVTMTLVDVAPEVGDAILGSAQVVGSRDHHGCEPQQRLGGAGFLADGPTAALRSGMRRAASVSVCRYGLRGDWSGTRLISSRLLTGPAARTLVEALRTAPRTSVAAPSRRCHVPEREFAVLELWPDRFDGAPAGGPASWLVRYDGCRGHGLYDGTAVRRLTSAVLRPILEPPWSGDIAPDLRRDKSLEIPRTHRADRSH